MELALDLLSLAGTPHTAAGTSHRGRFKGFSMHLRWSQRKR